MHAGRSIIGGGHIFIYSCSQTVKTIDFKILIRQFQKKLIGHNTNI